MIAKEQSLRDYFIEMLTNEIMNSDLKPGDKLKSIRELANEHHVSRSVINSGLFELAQNGLIEKDENNHYIVKQFEKYDRIETLLHFLTFENSSLDELEKKSIVEIKYGMDALAIDLLAGKLNKEDYYRLLDILNIKIAKDNNDLAHLAALEYFRFMKELYLLTNNMIMPLFLNSFIRPIIKLLEEYCTKTRFEELFMDSRLSLKALFEGRINDAKEYLKKRFLNAYPV